MAREWSEVGQKWRPTSCASAWKKVIHLSWIGKTFCSFLLIFLFHPLWARSWTSKKPTTFLGHKSFTECERFESVLDETETERHYEFMWKITMFRVINHDDGRNKRTAGIKLKSTSSTNSTRCIRGALADYGRMYTPLLGCERRKRQRQKEQTKTTTRAPASASCAIQFRWYLALVDKYWVRVSRQKQLRIGRRFCQFIMAGIWNFHFVMKGKNYTSFV